MYIYLANGLKERLIECGGGEDDLGEASGAGDQAIELGSRPHIGYAV